MFGLNERGELGMGDVQDRSVPTNVMNDIKYVSYGGDHWKNVVSKKYNERECYILRNKSVPVQVQ